MDNDIRPRPSCKLRLHREGMSELGTVVQTNQIGALKLTNDVHRWALVKQARAYSKKKVSLISKNVEVLLKQTSLVSTMVNILLLALLVPELSTEPSR